MKSKIVVLVLAVLLVGSLTTAAVALTKANDNDEARHSNAHGRGHHGQEHAGKDRGRQFGSPARPRARDFLMGHGPVVRPDVKALRRWRAMTPAQRAGAMARLAQEHADAMKKWATCVKAAGADRAARAACKLPLPPGLAKSRPAR